MADRISLRNLRASTIIGVHEEERRRAQEVVLRLDLELDLSPAAGSDRLEDAVDYEALAVEVRAFVERSRCRLLERLAGGVADLVLERFPKLLAATVTVAKPALAAAAGDHEPMEVKVALRRERSEGADASAGAFGAAGAP